VAKKSLRVIVSRITLRGPFNTTIYSMSEPTYDMFAGKGNHDCNVADRWTAYGVETSFDKDSKNMELILPPGWENTMTPEDHKAVADAWGKEVSAVDWCDDVTYELHLDRDNYAYRIEKIVAESLDEEGSMDISTPLAFEYVENAMPGTTIGVQLVAKVKTADGEVTTLKLVEGTLTIQDEPVAIGNNTAGAFVVVAGGLALFAHYDIGTKGRITHFAFMGKIHCLKLEYTNIN
jgi:hypothetical protein